MNHDQSHTPKPVTATCRPRRGLVGLLRSVAGAPAGWRPSRRGSFLVLVVGTLALLAVMAVVYTTIGNHDARMRFASDKREKLDDVPQQVADYIARLIGEDTVGVDYSTSRHADSSGFIVLERKISDYPSTSWQARSDRLMPTNGNNPVYPFSPTGSVTGFMTSADLTLDSFAASTARPSTMPRSWAPTSPYLAASEPTFLAYPVGGSARVLTDPTRPYLDMHDWAHISNISPDGYFVNLWNMRGNFDAHGLTGGTPVMSQNLTLYGNNGQVGATATDFGMNVDTHFPAHFDSRQQWLFRPARPTQGVLPNDFRYDPYQFADADGDGMYDSRWQSLDDLRSLLGVNIGGITSVLHTDGKIRYFVAARIIDASSMVNVNRAADQHVAPAGHMPAGMTPAEIDLQRILRMRDVYDLNGGATFSGYDGLFQPAGNVPGNYLAMNGDNGYDRLRAQIVGDLAYTSLRLALAGGSIPSGEYRGFGNGNPPFLTLAIDFPGQYGVNSGLALESWDNYVPTNFSAVPYLGFNDPVLRSRYYSERAGSLDDTVFQGAIPGAAPPTFGAATFTGSFGLDDQFELSARRTVNNPQYTSPLESTLDGRDDSTTNSFPNTLRFGVLRSNRPLSVEHDTRYPTPASITPNFMMNNPQYIATMLHFGSDVRQRLTTVSQSRDLRLLPGELDASGRFFPGVNSDSLSVNELRVDPRLAMEVIKTADNSVQNPPNPNLLKARSEAINSLFQGYANALLPTSGIGQPGTGSAWGSDNRAFANRMTEFYGQRGPELALHAAAHMTVNFMGMYNQGTIPAAHTLLLSNDAPSFVGNAANLPFYPAWDPQYYPPGDLPGQHNLHPLQLSGPNPQNTRLGNITQGDTISAPAVNVYGIEPQPFLTQVAAFTVYGDSVLTTSSDPNVVINGDVAFTNHDLMYRVVAFQLTNPFGVAITLGGAPSIGTTDTGDFDVMDPQYPRPDREPNFYYIRFGDKVFKIAALSEATYINAGVAGTRHQGNHAAVPSPNVNYPDNEVYIQGDNPDQKIHLSNISIPAGKSIVCYVLSDIPHRILKNRLAKLNETDSGSAGYYFNQTDGNTQLHLTELNLQVGVGDFLKSAIERQLNSDPNNPTDVSGVYWIPQIDVDVNNPTAGTGQVVLPDSTNLFPATQVQVVELWRSARYGLETVPTTVRLPSVEWDGITAPLATGTTNPTLTPPNDFRNDQLMDRMRVPSNFDLNGKSKLHDGPNVIGGSAVNNDAAHCYMVEAHASLRRKGDPRPNNAKPPLGAIPGYCIEPKYDQNWNLVEDSGFAGLSESDFDAGTNGSTSKGCERTPRQWLRLMRTSHLNHYNDYHMWQSLANNTVDSSVPNIVGPIDPNATGTPLSYDNFYPQINIANNEFRPTPPRPNPQPPGYQDPAISTLRIGDMLLPMGIGPEEVPFDAQRVAIPQNDERRWTTLGEALALSLGYQTGAPAGGAVDPMAVYLPDPSTGKAVLDRGNLRLDDYIPYYGDGSGSFNPATCDRLGNQIPIALNILDTFTVYPSRSVTTASNKQALEILPQTLTRGGRGKININTVPLNTLRPGFDLLSPPPQMDLSNPPQRWWWWGPDTVTNNPPLLDEHVDIAPTIVAYREKGTGFMRPGSFFGPSNNIDSVFFFDTAATPAQPATQDGRTVTTQIGQITPGTNNLAALHEQPGFRTIGELMNVRYRDGDLVNSPQYRCNMDWLAHDNLPPAPGVTPSGGPQNQTLYRPGASGHVGLDSVLFSTGTTAADHPSAVPRNYTQQLEILNGVLNNVSNRSDVFIAWFQIQGFQRSDVENLGDNDPMTPSVNRRFVMVIDRSKVTKRGQKADILLFKEVPVDPEPK
jgi:hypothetical protein